MQPCPRCSAVGTDPCVTPRGAIAASRHKVRPIDVIGELEQAALDSVAAAGWIGPADKIAVRSLYALARKADRVLLEEATRAASSPTLFPTDEPATKSEDVDGTWVYLMVNLGLQAGTLGLSPTGRKQLGIQNEEPDTDDLDNAIAELSVV